MCKLELLKELKEIQKVAERTKSYGFALLSRIKELENDEEVKSLKNIEENKTMAEFTKEMLAPYVEKAIKRKNSYEQGLE